MLPSDWDQAKQLFAEALPLAAPERERLLTGACAGRERLRMEVDSLLDAHGRAGGLLETSATVSERALRAVRAEIWSATSRVRLELGHARGRHGRKARAR